MKTHLHFLIYDIPIYSLFLVSGLVCAYVISYIRAKRERLDTDDMTVIGAVAIGIALVVAKMLYIAVTFTPAELMALIRAGELNAIIGGGLVFYGGLIGGIAGAVIGAKIAGTRLALYESAVVPTIPLAHAIGRVGCYFSGCCYGFPYDGPLAAKYAVIVDGAAEICTAFPVQLVEAAANLALGCTLLLLSRRRRIRLADYAAPYAVIRFALEFLRGDEVRGILAGLSSSQWISIALLAAVLAEWLIRRKVSQKNK